MAISPSVEYLERAWDDAKYGQASEHPYVEGVFPTVLEPSSRPGQAHRVGFTQFGPSELARAPGTRSARRTARGVATLARCSPESRGAVEHMEVLAPQDIEERFGLLGGNIFQGDMTPDQMFSFRPIPGYGDYRTPVEGLYLCGAGTHPAAA